MLRILFIFSYLFATLISVNVQAAEAVTSVTTTVEQPVENKTVTTTMSQSPDTGTVTKVVETRQTVVTPVPAAKEVIATPEGYMNCFNVEAGWFSNIWVPTHRVCQYDKNTEGVAWVEGYWGCNAATDKGVCTNWEWKAGHWEKTLSVY